MSVVVIAYNHAAYARQALESFVSQQTPFPFEVIVADDASTDETPEIVAEFAERYPDVVVPVLHTENLGASRNFVDAVRRARGDLIALCEADDFWTSDAKLARQAEVLDADPAIALVFHPTLVTWEGDVKPDSLFPPEEWQHDLSLAALLRHNFIHTSSVMYRNQRDYDDLPTDIQPLDWYLHVRHAIRGGIAMLPEPMSVYRRHPGGMWYTNETDQPAFWEQYGSNVAAGMEAILAMLPADVDAQASLGPHALYAAGQIDLDKDASRHDMVERFPRLSEVALRQAWTDLHRDRADLERYREVIADAARYQKNIEEQLRVLKEQLESAQAETAAPPAAPRSLPVRLMAHVAKTLRRG